MTQAADWFVVRTQPRRELQVEVVLQQRGIEVYNPRILSRKKDTQGQRKREQLFPGYLFARLALDSDHWLQARSAPGVSYFLGMRSQGRPLPVPDELVAQVRCQVETQLRHGWQPGLREGDKVEICSGPFAGLDAIFTGTLSPAGRSQVLVRMLNRLVPVQLETDVLKRAV